MAAEIESLLEYAVNTGSSELIITEGAAPAIRLAGQVCAVPDAPVIPFGSLAEFLGSLEGESGSMIGGPWQGMRWRVRYFREALGNGAVFRPLLNECPEFNALGVPPAVENMLGFSSGLVRSAKDFKSRLLSAGTTSTTEFSSKSLRVPSARLPDFSKVSICFWAAEKKRSVSPPFSMACCKAPLLPKLKVRVISGCSAL